MPRLRDLYHLDVAKAPFDMVEVAAAIAPRPFFSNSPLHDENFSVAGVEKAEPELRKVYHLLGADDAFQVHIPIARTISLPKSAKRRIGLSTRRFKR